MKKRFQKSSILFALSLIAAFGGLYFYAQATPAKMLDEFSIFDHANNRRPINLACSNCPKDTEHGAKLDKDVISWNWDKKFSCWCGWMFQGLGRSDFSGDIEENYALEIIYKGKYEGNPSPQVKFLDKTGYNTKIRDFSDYSSDKEDNTVVCIPIKDFGMKYTVDATQIEKLQFDAGWDSTNGRITIKSVKLVKKDKAGQTK